VLQSSYAVSEAEFLGLVENLLSTTQLVIEKRDCVNRALQACLATRPSNVGFVDFIIDAIAIGEGCEFCVTFDKKAARTTGMKILGSAFFPLV
jgi:predicted nucleic-acid-binding protein